MITFSGFRVGEFDFDSRINGRRYSLVSRAKASVFFGSYKWRSSARTEGIVRSAEPSPSTFEFDYRSSRKRSRTLMSFGKNGVEEVANRPPVSRSKKRVPLGREHLVGVLDPLSAIMAMTRGRTGNPCSQTLDIFDGKQRVRLRLTSSGRTRIKERRRSGQPLGAYRCRVKFIPVAGHKRSRQLDYVARSKIEIVMRPIPSANIFVPVQVVIPTMVGSVMLTSKRVDITNAARQQIALRH